MRLLLRAGVGCLAVFTAALACTYPFYPGPPPPPFPPPEVPPPTSPENLVWAVEVHYNDRVRAPGERLEAYAKLFAPEFLFHYWAADGDSLAERTWDLAEELDRTRCLFGSYVLTVAIGDKEVRDPGSAYPSGWKEVRAGTVHGRLLTSLRDRHDFAGPTRFICAPSGGRWFIMAWFDPAEPTRASTWATVKRCPSSEHR